MAYDVFGVGNAIVDIQLKVDERFLTQIAVTKGLMTLVEAEKQVDVLAALAGKTTHRCSGGSAPRTGRPIRAAPKIAGPCPKDDGAEEVDRSDGGESRLQPSDDVQPPADLPRPPGMPRPQAAL